MQIMDMEHGDNEYTSRLIKLPNINSAISTFIKF